MNKAEMNLCAYLFMDIFTHFYWLYVLRGHAVDGYFTLAKEFFKVVIPLSKSELFQYLCCLIVSFFMCPFPNHTPWT
jgi:hypothetical protein